MALFVSKKNIGNLCQQAVSNQIDINEQDESGWTILHHAASQNNDSICDSLIKAGADVNIQNVHGNTALGIAALNGNNDAATALIYGGADTSIKNNDLKTADEIADSYARVREQETPTGELIRKLPLKVKLEDGLKVNQTANRSKVFKQ